MVSRLIQKAPGTWGCRMNIVVLLEVVPATAEELTVAADGKSLDTEFLGFDLGDAEEHTVEEALSLKESGGGQVTVIGLDVPERREPAPVQSA